jgi:hypothetical protein
MRVVGQALIAVALVFGVGCAKTDWIDRTLVTVDVTGTWYGYSTGGVGRETFLELKQEGSRVTGSIRIFPGGSISKSELVDGNVSGDVFRFRQTNGSVEGELTVNGDEMDGRVSLDQGSRPLSLRRVDPSSPPASPLR